MMIDIFQGDDAELALEFLQPLSDDPMDMTGHTVDCLVCDANGSPVDVDTVVVIDSSKGLYLQPLKLLSIGQHSIQVVTTDTDGKVKHQPIINISVKKVLPHA